MRTTPRSLFAWSSVLSLSYLISSVMVVVVDAERKCSLCESVQDVPKRLDYILEVSPSVVRCADAWINMGLLDIHDSKCTILQNEYREKCCGEEEPAPMYSPPTSSPPPGDSNVGTEPFCRICGDDKYPGSPDTHIVARYVGSATCGQLYHRGRQGTIPGFMCGPLQDFAYGVCQCANGSTLPNNNGGGGPSPTTPAPTPDPTPAPTPDPTPPPVSPPPTTTTRAPSPTFEMVPTAIGARKVNNNGGSKEDQKIAGARYSRFNKYGNRRALDSRIDPSAKEEPTEVVV
eukprot:scaffold1088_cov90-Cylindrotheca_fusiformis.AAC.2